VDRWNGMERLLVMRTVFVGTSAFLGRIDGETRCAFWAEEPVDHAFDRTGWSRWTLP